MTDQVSTDDLVTSPAAATEPAPPPPATATPKPAKPKKRRRPSKVRRAKAQSSAREAAGAKEKADEAAAKAKTECSLATATERSSAYEAALLNEADAFAELPEGEAMQLRFADGSAFIEGSVKVGAEQLRRSGDYALYEGEVIFPPDAEPGHMSEAWLIADNGASRRCRMLRPVPIGGGKAVRLPAGSLRF